MEVESKQTILPPSAPVEGTASRTLNPVAAETSEAPTTGETAAGDVPTTLAASVEHPSPAGSNGGSPPVATEAIAPPQEVTSEEVTSNTSQESHA
jgi:hypothetical protein